MEELEKRIVKMLEDNERFPVAFQKKAITDISEILHKLFTVCLINHTEWADLHWLLSDYAKKHNLEHLH